MDKIYLTEIGNSIDEIIDFEIHKLTKNLNKIESSEVEKDEIEKAFRAGMEFSFIFQELLKNKLRQKGKNDEFIRSGKAKHGKRNC